uniref:Dehydrogenase/reductase 1 n=1 Tax=Equus caballus TaxID=9796 RepID=F6Q1B4_HORSE
MAAPMKGQVCVVTGASRGIGRGIALQLCQAGATVYITGRHLDTLQVTAQEAQSRGGRCVPVVCDSSQESQVQSLFEQVNEEQGRLDVLVNNAYAGVQAILTNAKKPFWESPASLWDDMNNVGLRMWPPSLNLPGLRLPHGASQLLQPLGAEEATRATAPRPALNTVHSFSFFAPPSRGHYLCSVYGARLMVPAGRGLIVVISSAGGLQYLFNVSYGVGKAACDRLAADCAQELRCHGVSYVSLWPGLVQTELLKDHLMKDDNTEDSLFNLVRNRFSSAETTEMSGKCVVALATDPNILSLSGKVLPSCDLARRYGLRDVDGRPVDDYFSLSSVLTRVSSLGWLASFLPSFLRVPKWILTLYTSKF